MNERKVERYLLLSDEEGINGVDMFTEAEAPSIASADTIIGWFIKEEDYTTLCKALQFCRDVAHETPEMSKENRVGKALSSIYERCCAALPDEGERRPEDCRWFQTDGILGACYVGDETIPCSEPKNCPYFAPDPIKKDEE